LPDIHRGSPLRKFEGACRASRRGDEAIINPFVLLNQYRRSSRTANAAAGKGTAPRKRGFCGAANRSLQQRRARPVFREQMLELPTALPPAEQASLSFFKSRLEFF
jgi:hypothetical protein